MRNIFIILFFFALLHSARADDGTIRRIRVPILMYHYVSPLPPDADDIRAGLTVSPETFRSHIEFLKSEGYETISLYEMNTALEYGLELPEKPIVLTFDDSYTDHYQYVFPVLKEFGYTGTFFVITGSQMTVIQTISPGSKLKKWQTQAWTWNLTPKHITHS
jgi:peptidoglycan/xylan/chitin deacetylase (PgdA/CDA1 family)